MKKLHVTILSTLLMMFMLAGCGGRGGDVGGGPVDSGKVDPFDPAIFDVESGGIVFHYNVDTSVYGENLITDVEIENQLPESDIRSTFTYEMVEAEDSGAYLDGLWVGDKVAIEVTAPDEFWENNDMTETRTDFIIPPVPCAQIRGSLITEDVVREHLPEIAEGLNEVIEGKYYYNFPDTTGNVKDLVDTSKIYLEGGSLMYVSARANEPNDEGKTVYLELGIICFTYNEDKELVVTCCHKVVDESGEEHYYTRNDDHLIPNVDAACFIVPSAYDEENAKWVDELPAADRYLDIDGYATAEPEPTYIYNYNTGDLQYTAGN